MGGCLGQVAAGGAVVGIVVSRERVFALCGSGSVMVVIGTFAMMMVVMALMLGNLLANLAIMHAPVRMAPSCQQTVSQVQQDCTKGDDFEGLAEHGLPDAADSNHSAEVSQLQSSCITESLRQPLAAGSLLFSHAATFYDDPVIVSGPHEVIAKVSRK